MILGAVLQLMETTAVVYAILLTAYLVTGRLFFTNNPDRPDKIQRGEYLPPEKVRRDIKQSIRSLFSVSLMFSIGHVAYVRFHIGFVEWPTSVWSVLLSLLLSMLAYDAWFYWMHRALHSKPFYRAIHRWHHLSMPPVSWSNNSDTLIDNMFLQSYWMFAHLIFPVAPAVLLFNKLYDQISGVIGHSGVEHAGGTAWPPSPMISVTHHDQHHRFFNCNYATHFTLWDRLMGTLHATHDAEVKENLRRRRQPSPTTNDRCDA